MHDIESPGRRAQDDETVAGALLACHDRIRAFLVVAARVAGSEPASPEDVASAAASLARYFKDALPRHARDEDESLTPRLLAAGFDAEALATLAREHAGIDELLARLVPAWSSVARDPGLRASVATAADVQRLATIFERHLAWEEEHLIPQLANWLDPAALAEIRREMRARR